jgi:hypothetical protein
MAISLRSIIGPRPKREFLSQAFSKLGFNLRGFYVMLPGAPQPIAFSTLPSSTVLSANNIKTVLSVGPSQVTIVK